MAIRKRAGSWQVYWNNPFTDKRESVTVENESDAKKKDALVKYQLQYERESFRRDETKEETKQKLAPRSHTLESVYYLYLKEKQFTKKGLEWQLVAMRTPLGMLGDTPLSEITFQKLQGVKSALSASGIKGVSVRNRLSVLRTVLRWAYSMEYMESMPRFPVLPPADYEKFIPPTQEELSRMIQVAAPHIQRVIVLGSQFGIRIGPSEIFKLRWQDVDLFRRVIRVPAAKKNHAEPWREVPIRTALFQTLLDWKLEDEKNKCDWVIHSRGKSVTTIKTAWRSMLDRSGITRRIRPYDLRHTFATEAIAAGADIGTVAKLMGHTTTNMIFQHYQHVLTRQKIAVVESLPDVPHVPKSMCQKK